MEPSILIVFIILPGALLAWVIYCLVEAYIRRKREPKPDPMAKVRQLEAELDELKKRD